MYICVDFKCKPFIQYVWIRTHSSLRRQFIPIFKCSIAKQNKDYHQMAYSQNHRQLGGNIVSFSFCYIDIELQFNIKKIILAYNCLLLCESHPILDMVFVSYAISRTVPLFNRSDSDSSSGISKCMTDAIIEVIDYSLGKLKIVYL